MDFLSSIDPVYAAVLVLSALFMFGLHTVIYKVSSKNPAPAPLNAGNPQPMAQNRARQQDEEVDNDEDDDSSDDEGPNQANNGRDVAPKMIGKKKRLKMERKAALKEYRKYQLEQSKERQAEQKKELKELRKAEKVLDSEKATEEEAWEKYIAEKRRKEQEEYERWKGTMEIGESGSGDQDRWILENQAENIIAVIHAERVVVLEALSARFHTSTNLLVELLTKLVKERRLEGILDESGKFIHVSREDRLKIAKIVQRRGRVDISDITREANLLISLEPILAPSDLPEPVASSS
jgi:hypothetical protein